MAPRQSVEYLLVAEFDIDKGPIISHQYPEPLSSDVKQLAELMLPDQTHVRTEDWTIFFLHFTPAGKKRPTAVDALDEPDEPPLMYVLNLVNTKHDKEARRGAQVKALAIVTRYAFLHIYKPILLLALDEYFKHPSDDALAILFEAVNGMDLAAMPKLNQLERLTLLQSDREDLYSERFPGTQRERSNTASSDASALSFEQLALDDVTPSSLRDTHEFMTSIAYQGTKIPVRVPMTSLPEIVGDCSVTQLITTFQTPTTYACHSSLTTSGPTTHPVIVLLNALLTQNRVVILGRSQPSGVVANHVLAACAMASGGTGLLRSFTERAFPYTDLSKIDDLLTVDGFIAGVTNSIFEVHPEWWDVMANIDTGQVIISPQKQLDGIAPPSPMDSGDVAFMDDLNAAIADRCSESVVRLKFRDYLSRFVKMTMTYEETKYGTSQLSPLSVESFLLPGHGIVWHDEAQKKRELAANSGRIEAWSGTESYVCCATDCKAQYVRGSSRVRTFDVAHHVERLRSAHNLSKDASGSIYIVMNQEILTEIHLTELLTLMPSSQGGMWFLAQGLFHPSPVARRAAINLIERVREHAVGRYYYAAMSRFYRVAHERMLRDLDWEDASIESAVRHELV